MAATCQIRKYVMYLVRDGQTERERKRDGACSRSAALDESWVEAYVSDVMSVQQPGEETLQPQTITAMRTCAIFSLKHKHARFINKVK